MKSTINLVSPLIFVLALATSFPAALNAASSEEPQSVSSPDSLPFQIWKDPSKFEDLKDVLFDFDTHESASDPAILEANIQWLKDHPNVRLTLAGFTDIRGDIVYNLALSQRRAQTVKQELIRRGIAENRIVYATGWGELYPNCLEATEECWKLQRRVEFVQAGR